MWEVPTLKDELERKTLEHLQWIVDSFSSCQISASEAKVAVQTVFGLVSGLVSSDVTQAIDTIEADPLAKAVIRRVFYGQGNPKLFVMTWIVGEQSFTARGIPLIPGQNEGFKKYDLSDAKDASQMFHSMCNGLVSSYGLSEI